MIVKNSLAMEMNYSFKKSKTISLSLYFGRDRIQMVVYSSSGKWNTRERTFYYPYVQFTMLQRICVA